jgi:hypothetical protein
MHMHVLVPFNTCLFVLVLPSMEGAFSFNFQHYIYICISFFVRLCLLFYNWIR